jgi:hypothetical protein
LFFFNSRSDFLESGLFREGRQDLIGMPRPPKPIRSCSFSFPVRIFLSQDFFGKEGKTL